MGVRWRRSAIGHNPPVWVTFQFSLVVRPVIELSGRYSASKLMTALAQPGHNRPFELTFQFLLVGRLAIELNGRYSASKLMSALAQPGQERTLKNSAQNGHEAL